MTIIMTYMMIIIIIIIIIIILRKINASHEWGKKEYKLNHLLLMDNLKLFLKSEEQQDKLARTVYVFSTDIGIEFEMKKCGTLTIKKGK